MTTVLQWPRQHKELILTQRSWSLFIQRTARIINNNNKKKKIYNAHIVKH